MVKNKEKKFISALVYLNNDENRVAEFIIFLNRILSDNFEKYEIICIDDFSNDRTIDILKETAKNIAGGIITVINMSFYQGLEKSMNAGMDLAIGDFVYSFDTVDVDYSEDLVLQAYKKLHEGYDIVSISNNLVKLTSSLFYYLMNSHSKNKLVTDTFSIISRRAINRIKATSISVPYRKVVYQNCGLNTYVIFYKPVQNIKINHSENDRDIRFDNAITSIILYTNHAYNFAMSLAAIMMLATLLGLIYSLVIYIIGKPMEGYTTIMLVITSSFFALFVLMAILIKYASIILDLVYKKQTYLVKTIDKLNDRG